MTAKVDVTFEEGVTITIPIKRGLKGSVTASARAVLVELQLLSRLKGD